MKTKPAKLLQIIAILLSAGISASAQATTIPLVNHSFESPVVNPWSSGFLPDGWSWDYGSYIQSPAAHDGNQGVVNLGSVNTFFRLSQSSTYTVARANESITGKVWVRITNMERGASSFELVILIGGVPVATNTFVVTTGMLTGQSLDWTQISVEYLTTSSDIGQSVGIALGNDGGDNSEGYSPSYCYMDDVSLDTVSAGGPTAVGIATPNPAELHSNVLFSVTVTPGDSPAITSVVLDASAIGGSSTLALVSSGGYEYTNTVAASAPSALDTVLHLPATVTDGSGLVGQADITLVINRPSQLIWGGGFGNWSDLNWMPYNLSGPVSGANRFATVTNGQVLVDIPGGVGGVASITVAESGLLQVHNVHYGAYGNIRLAGGTLDTADDSSYHAYGASVLSAVTASGTVPSTIANSGLSWFNLSDPASTFTVEEGATLTVSAALAGAVASNDNLFNPSGLTKAGAGTLILAGANTYSGGTTVEAGTLSIAAVEALQTNTSLAVAAGAKAALDFSGTIPLSALVLDGVSQAAGTHGATGSGATHVNDLYFTGTGLVEVAAPVTLSLLYANLGNGQLELSWDGSATLQVQTNTPAAGLAASGWVDLPDSSPAIITIDPAGGGLFFRLRQ